MTTCCPKKLYYGWVVVAAAGLAVICSFPGCTFGISFFIPELQRELNLTHTEISAVWGGGVFLVAIVLPFVGRLVDWQGPWRVIFITSLPLALACFGMSHVNSWWMLLLLIAALRLFGIGFIYVAGVRAANHWFVKKRGRVSVVIIIMFYSMMALPAVVHYLIGAFGWRNAYRILAAFLLIGLIIVLLFIRDSPELYGMLPDGELPEDVSLPELEQTESSKSETIAIAQSNSIEMIVVSADLEEETRGAVEVKKAREKKKETKSEEFEMGTREACKFPIFWVLAVNIFVVELYWCAVQFNILSLFGENSKHAKLHDSDVVIIMVVLSVASGCSSVCSGVAIEWLRERRRVANVPHRKGLMILVSTQMMLTAMSCVLLIHVTDLVSATVWSLLFSAMIGIQDVVMMVAFAEIFGKNKIGEIMGVITSVMTLATTFGPVLGAVVLENNALEYFYYPIAGISLVIGFGGLVVADPKVKDK